MCLYGFHGAQNTFLLFITFYFSPLFIKQWKTVLTNKGKFKYGTCLFDSVF